jgi:hypothetical protein
VSPIVQLRQHRPASDQFWECHSFPGCIRARGPSNCTHVFLCQDATCWTQESPYNGRYQVLSRREKTLQLFVCGKPLTTSTDRVKLSYTVKEADCKNTTFNPAASTIPAIALPAIPPWPPATQTTRSCRQSVSPHATTPEQPSPQWVS